MKLTDAHYIAEYYRPLKTKLAGLDPRDALGLLGALLEDTIERLPEERQAAAACMFTGLWLTKRAERASERNSETVKG
jgi:hypothetical protein